MSSPLLLSTRIQEGYFAPAYRATLLYLMSGNFRTASIFEVSNFADTQRFSYQS
jgi:hypothetical protein